VPAALARERAVSALELELELESVLALESALALESVSALASGSASVRATTWAHSPRPMQRPDSG
jgi:hypothetical protein